MLKTLTINAITQYIDENLESTPIDINTLVIYSGYSRRYLQLLFKQSMGIPVGKYIQLRRVTRAAALLRFTSLNIVEISERLFYDSQQTFTREFRKNSGYTPLQYRKNKVWAFKNMLGHREVNSNIPAPDIRFLERKTFRGFKIFYKEPIPSTNPLSAVKWSTVDSFLSEGKGSICISHKLIADTQDKDNISFNAIFWDVEGAHDSEGELEEGFYAYFSFKGPLNEYKKFTYNIYMNALPFYDLQHKNSYDLEIVTKGSDDLYHFEYYLPLCKGD